MYKGTSDCMPTPDMALSLRVITRRNSSMAARTAFELARQRGGMKKVTAVHKNTVFKLGCGLFLDACREVADGVSGHHTGDSGGGHLCHEDAHGPHPI